MVGWDFSLIGGCISGRLAVVDSLLLFFPQPQSCKIPEEQRPSSCIPHPSLKSSSSRPWPRPFNWQSSRSKSHSPAAWTKPARRRARRTLGGLPVRVTRLSASCVFTAASISDPGTSSKGSTPHVFEERLRLEHAGELSEVGCHGAQPRPVSTLAMRIRRLASRRRMARVCVIMRWCGVLVSCSVFFIQARAGFLQATAQLGPGHLRPQRPDQRDPEPHLQRRRPCQGAVLRMVEPSPPTHPP